VFESWFMIVSCEPRLTVSVCGQMELFMMTRVFGLALGVHPPDGWLGLDELPPHERAPARARVAAAMPTIGARGLDI
jgi:hypothetical protein